jgi:hypothetical protein
MTCPVVTPGLCLAERGTGGFLNLTFKRSAATDHLPPFDRISKSPHLSRNGPSRLFMSAAAKVPIPTGGVGVTVWWVSGLLHHLPLAGGAQEIVNDTRRCLVDDEIATIDAEHLPGDQPGRDMARNAQLGP